VHLLFKAEALFSRLVHVQASTTCSQQIEVTPKDAVLAQLLRRGAVRQSDVFGIRREHEVCHLSPIRLRNSEHIP
jgi:hypothetical protein